VNSRTDAVSMTHMRSPSGGDVDGRAGGG